MKKSVLITGSKGFIGKNLMALIQRHYDVIEYSYNILDKESFLKFEDKKIDHVIHLAAKSFVPQSWNNPNLFYQTNVIGTQNVLDFCNTKKANLTFLSSYMYGIPEYLPIDEKHKTQALNPYAHSKLLAEELCEFYSKNFGINTTILRLFNVYGKGQDEHFLIPSILKQIKETKEIIVKDDTPKRDFIHIDDVVKAIFLSINSNFKFEVFNIASGKSYSVKEVVEIFIKASNFNIKYSSSNEQRPNEIPDTIADISKAKSLLGWEVQTPFEEGIIKLMEDIN